LRKKFYESLTSVHPGLTEEQVTLLIAETRKLSQAYEPYTQFKESAYSGKYVNVDPRDFGRSETKGPGLPGVENSLFVSVAPPPSGMEVADDLTIPAQLQKQLVSDYGVSASVYNLAEAVTSAFRRGCCENCYSGFVPDVAVFIDGLNDLVFFEPARTKDLGSSWKRPSLPLMRRIAGASSNEGPSGNVPIARKFRRNQLSEGLQSNPPDQHPKMLQDVVDRYLSNKRITEAIAREFNVTPVFVCSRFLLTSMTDKIASSEVRL
jgi:hypothetical protein